MGNVLSPSEFKLLERLVAAQERIADAVEIRIPPRQMDLFVGVPPKNGKSKTLKGLPRR